MKTLCTVVTLRFWAEYPDDDLEADAQADRISDELERFANALPYVAEGSASIQDLETSDD